MHAEGRRRLRVVLSLLLMLCGTLFAVSVHRGSSQLAISEVSATLFDEPQFWIQFGRNQLRIGGATVSADHEAALLRLVDEQFKSADAQTEFRSAIGMTPDWETVSTRLLYLVAATNSANALLDADGVEIHGTTPNSANFENRLTFLQSAMTAEKDLIADVLAVDMTPLDTLCRRAFDSLNTQAIRFRQASDSIRRSSYPVLHRLVEFAFNCRKQKLVIAGHSDATGNEAWNLKLSRARAQAVADHLAQKGISPNRLLVAGFGSSLPIADNDTVQGREQNRRIEIDLL